MRTLVRGIAAVLVLAIVALGIWVAIARSGGLDADPGDALARYATPPSQFMDVDGTRIHYRDEGQGPVLVMLHGSRASLHQWDGWIRAFGGRFRTVRLDILGQGLTGPDGRGDYSPERQLQLLDGLLNRLKVERATFVGTSGGATLAVRYAALHPERVERLVLSTVPLMLPPQSSASGFDAAVFWFYPKVLGSLGSDLYWRTFLRSIYGNPDKVTPELVTRYRILNTLPGQQQRFDARLVGWRQRGGAKEDFATAAKITVPVLLQWGERGPVLPTHLHCAIANAFVNAPVRVISYPELGHKLVMEDAERTARDALAFIDGAEVGRTCPPGTALTLSVKR
jgi:pimeloyl-ACP methyl ester carboxylesterase